MAIAPSLFFRLSSASFWQANHKEYILFFRQVGNIMLNLFLKIAPIPFRILGNNEKLMKEYCEQRTRAVMAE